MLGLHASHELFAPGVLLDAVRRAEAVGFGGAMCSDHFHPWTARRFAQSGFAWAWLGAALASTQLSCGVVNAPGQRYHPAIIAQASATLAAMYPRRFWLALGSGEAINESITGDTWPSKTARHARLRECVDIIRALWRGETVTHEGAVRVVAARLATRPEIPPALVGAAITEETAEWTGAWADGLITVGSDVARLRRTIAAFRRGGGGSKPVLLQLTFAYAPADPAAAFDLARFRWPHAALTPRQLADLGTPEDVDHAVAELASDQLRRGLPIATDLGTVRGWIEDAFAAGVEDIYLSPVVEDLSAFVTEMGNA